MHSPRAQGDGLTDLSRLNQQMLDVAAAPSFPSPEKLRRELEVVNNLKLSMIIPMIIANKSYPPFSMVYLPLIAMIIVIQYTTSLTTTTNLIDYFYNL